MNKKGFSLIEIIVVIIILSIITVISVPIITNIITDYKEKAYIEQEKAIVNAAKTYIASHNSLLPNNNTSICVSVDNLKNEGLLEDEIIKNPVGENYKIEQTEIYKEKDAEFNGGVEITKKEKQYIYTYVDTCN